MYIQRTIRALACVLAVAIGCAPGVAVSAEIDDPTKQEAAADAPNTSRIVSVGGSITEIVYALRGEGRLVGVDTSSVYPEAATQLPQVGYQRNLSAEGIVSLRPTLVLATVEAGPPSVLEQVRAAGVAVRLMPADATVAGAAVKIRDVAAVLGRADQGEALVRSMEADLAAATAARARSESRPRVLFIYARGPGTVNVSGLGTAADAIIDLAGGTNAIREFEGFRPLTPEAAVTARPDVLLLPTRGLESLGGAAAVMQLPGVALTPAAQERRLVSMDDLYLLGFGPRLGQAVRELTRLLHAEPQGLSGSGAAVGVGHAVD